MPVLDNLPAHRASRLEIRRGTVRCTSAVARAILAGLFAYRVDVVKDQNSGAGGQSQNRSGVT